MSFRFIPLGVGDAFSASNYTFCIAICADDRWWLVDCPHPIRKIVVEGGKRAGVDLDVMQLEGVLQTHLHADHCSGLEGLAYLAWFLRGAPLPIAAHPEVVRDLWDGSLRAGMEMLMTIPGYPEALGAEPVFTQNNFEKFFAHQPLSLEDKVEVGPFVVECKRTVHHIFTTAFRITAHGKTLGISADTCFDPELIEWLMESDVVVHETGHGVHTPLDRLTALPKAQRDKMRLIHFPDDYDVAGANIEALVEGRLYEV